MAEMLDQVMIVRGMAGYLSVNEKTLYRFATPVLRQDGSMRLPGLDNHSMGTFEKPTRRPLQALEQETEDLT